MVTLATPLAPICIGIDVGKIQDNTALSVAEVTQVDTGRVRYGTNITLGHHDKYGMWVEPTGMYPVMTSEYTIRHITRLPLGLSYPKVAAHVVTMLENPLFRNREVRVLIDVTGVGRPVYDDIYEAIELQRYRVHEADSTHPTGARNEQYRIWLKPISFVHGEKYNRATGTLGKAYLVSRLQSLLQSGRVHAPDTREVRATLEELKVYEIKVDQDGKDTYGASTGKHDDLATALALACLEDPYSERVSYSERIF